MSIKGQGRSLILVKGHSVFKAKYLTFGLYTQVSDSGPLGPLVSFSDLYVFRFNSFTCVVLMRVLYVSNVMTLSFIKLWSF